MSDCEPAAKLKICSDSREDIIIELSDAHAYILNEMVSSLEYEEREIIRAIGKMVIDATKNSKKLYKQGKLSFARTHKEMLELMIDAYTEEQQATLDHIRKEIEYIRSLADDYDMH